MQSELPLRPSSELGIVRDQYEALLRLLGNLHQQIHDRMPRCFVEITCRLIGEDERWIVDQSTRHGYPLALTT